MGEEKKFDPNFSLRDALAKRKQKKVHPAILSILMRLLIDNTTKPSTPTINVNIILERGELKWRNAHLRRYDVLLHMSQRAWAKIKDKYGDEGVKVDTEVLLNAMFISNKDGLIKEIGLHQCTIDMLMDSYYKRGGKLENFTNEITDELIDTIIETVDDIETKMKKHKGKTVSDLMKIEAKETIIKQVGDMLRIQDEFNTLTAGADWKSGVAANGKAINWLRCIRQEVSELIDSTPWPHWKYNDVPIDIDNVRTEIVDIWHFILSEALRIYQLDTKLLVDDELSDLSLTNEIVKIIFETVKETIPVSEELILECAEELQSATYYAHLGIDDMIVPFTNLMFSAGMGMDDLYVKYLGKAGLNVFRQNNGYSGSTYRKTWTTDFGSYEDNWYVSKFLKDNKNFTSEELMVYLDTMYQDTVSRESGQVVPEIN